MPELEKYERSAIPAHVWTVQDAISAPQPEGWTRRNWVYRAAASRGAEAIPSPGVGTL